MFLAKVICKNVNYFVIFIGDAAASPINIKKLINILTYNFSKEQFTLPADDQRIETCRSILSILV